MSSGNISSALGLDRERERESDFRGRLGKLIELPPPQDRLRERVGYVHSDSRVACRNFAGGVEVKGGCNPSSNSGSAFVATLGRGGVPRPKVCGEPSRCGLVAWDEKVAEMDMTGEKEVFCDETRPGVCGLLPADDSRSVSGNSCGGRLERAGCECIECDLEPDEDETVPAGDSGWEEGVSCVEAATWTLEGDRVAEGVTGTEVRGRRNLDDLECPELFDPEPLRWREPNSSLGDVRTGRRPKVDQALPGLPCCKSGSASLAVPEVDRTPLRIGVERIRVRNADRGEADTSEL